MPNDSELMQSLGYTFSNPKLLKLALIHPSLGDRNNQRLEFLGDAVLELCMSDLLFVRHPGLSEGELTVMRASLVCEAALFSVAQRLHLEGYIRLLHPQSHNSAGRRSIMADALEAIIAAVYLDGGLANAQGLVATQWEELFERTQSLSNYKSSLQEILQADGFPEPSYITVLEEGPPHRRIFTVAVMNQGQELARAIGNSKKMAEQEAARLALQTLQKPAGNHDET
jgi:ribonuclease-3